ncbi:MAG: GLUG motif-containing protein, partial [Alphaproteobacteria bacterium]|nr:GLUG motif-containing protein [Alphaproteobacteria bacterium]
MRTRKPWLLTFLLASVSPYAVLANPTGGTVVSGAADIESSGATLTVRQSTDKAIIDWRSFDIGVTETTTFEQPSSSSVALNRVNSAGASMIEGTLTANGNIVIVNANGVVFGAGSVVDVNGLLVTTADIENERFMAGDLTFDKAGNPEAVIESKGTITARDAGLVGLVAPTVLNSGVITAKLGRIHLASGEKVTVDFYGDGLLEVEASAALTEQIVKNEGRLEAEGGTIALTAAAAGEEINSLVEAGGSIKATAVETKNGHIYLYAEKGETKVAGTLDASSAEGTGGHIEVLGETVTLTEKAEVKATGAGGGGTIEIGDATGTRQTTLMRDSVVNASATENGDGGSVTVWSAEETTVAGSLYAKGGEEGGDGGFIETSSVGSVHIEGTAKVNTLAPMGATGLWLLDPTDYTIAASGGDETGASVTASLTTSNRMISTTGSIYVTDDVSWSANTLTLEATAGDIAITETMTATGTAGLVLTYTGDLTFGLTGTGFAGSIDIESTGTLAINGQAYTIITSLGSEGSTTATDLQGINGALSGYYVLGSDVDASSTASWNSGAGFDPLGDSTTLFTGTFNGLGHTITGLTISRASENYVGLFGYAGETAVIKNVGLINASVEGQSYVGVLAGYNMGALSDSYATGNVTGESLIGGLNGKNYLGTLRNSYATANVSGESSAGGLVGVNQGAVTGSYATGTVSADSYTGGLAGKNYFGSIETSYATGTVSGIDHIGGLAGVNSSGSIETSYATGDVTGTGSFVGGLIGYSTGTINQSYATGDVDGDLYVGGLVGENYSGSVSGSYATGLTTGSDQVGGLVGWSNGSISDSYALGAVSGSSSVGGLVGVNQGSIEDSYATGAVTGDGDGVGGLVGSNSGSATIADSYATGIVIGHSTRVGGLAGVNIGDIESSYASGSVTGDSSYVGGLVGNNYTGTINDSYATGAVTGVGHVGGLSGINSSSGTITQSYATGDVTGTGSCIGGLVGSNGSGSTISDSYATGNVTGQSESVGGLVGYNSSAPISMSYATGNVVAGGSYAGGLVGYNYESSISDSYALGSVSGVGVVGGLVGLNRGGSVNDSYAAGFVSGSYTVGGLIGTNHYEYEGTVYEGTVSGSYWNVETSGMATGVGGGAAEGATGLTTAQLMTQASLSGWDFASTWAIIEGASYPYLQWQGDIAVVRGTTDLASGTGVGAVVNGAAVGSGSVGSDGSFYVILPEGSLDAGNAWLLYEIDGGASGSNLVSDTDGSSRVLSGLTWTAGGLSVSSVTDTVSSSTLVTALGDLSLSDVLYTVTSGTITLSGDAALSDASVSIDSPIAWSGSTLTLEATAGDIVLDADLAGTGTAGLVLTYTGDLTFGLTGTGFAGSIDIESTGTLAINGQAYTIITSLGSEGSTTGTDLQGINGALSGYYVLGSDVDASSTASWNSGAGFDPLGDSTTLFTGTFNGLGHTITGLTISRASENYVGLFGYAGAGSVISNTGILEASVVGSSSVGTLVGKNSSGSIHSSYATGNVTGSGERTGGLVGWNDGGTINASYAMGSVTGTRAHTGGLVGYNSGTINGSYATGSIWGDSSVGGLIGYNYGGTISDSYATGSVSGSGYYVGGLVGSNAGGTIDESYAAGAATGSSDYVGGLVGYSDASGTILASYATGSVSGISSVGGLIGYNSGTIENSHATGNASGTGSNVGGLVGKNDSGTILYSYATGIVTGTGNGLGGLVGRNDNGSVTGSYATGSVSGASSVGGLVGYNYSGTILYSYATGDTSGTGSNVGGLVGSTVGGSIDESYATGSVSGSYYVGGLVGYNNGTIGVSYATGSVTGTGNDIGGLVGRNDDGAVTGSYATGSVSGSSYSVGGLIGYNSGSINDSHATGSISGATYVGGLLGYSDASSTILASYATGSVSGTSSVGGLIGYNSSTIENSYATGDASGTGSNVGGLVGKNDSGTILYSYATGIVTGTGNGLGGLVGRNDNGSVTGSYATGSVSGASSVGGLVGYNYTSGTISSSYATGAVTGTGDYIGGLVGYNADTITSSYWNVETSGMATGVGGGAAEGATGLTTAQLMTEASLSGWDFASTWAIIEGASYPYLQWQGAIAVVRGTTDLASGTGVGAVVNGAAVGSGSVGSDGSFYVMLPEGSLASGNAFLLYEIDGGASGSNLVSDTDGSSRVLSGLTWTAGGLSVSSLSDTVSSSTLVTALGDLSLSDVLYTVTSGTITLSGDAALSDASVSIDSPIAWSGNTLTLEATAGDIAITETMTATGTAGLVLTYTGDLTFGLTGTGFAGSIDIESTGTLAINGQAY